MFELTLPSLKPTGTMSPEWIWDYIQSINADEMLAAVEFPSGAEGGYARKTLQKEPFEVTLIQWPAKGQSAVHKHDGFFGAVRVLKGALVNKAFEHQGHSLVEYSVAKFLRDGVVEEPDGMIHQLVNEEATTAVSLHVYAPAIETFAGMRLYDLETGSIGVLSNTAKSASWNVAEDGHFQQIDRAVFTYISYQHLQHGSHMIYPLVPKPASESINTLLRSYYNEQAAEYDLNDHQSTWRREYTRGINELVAKWIEEHTVKNYLALCAGTGRRPVRIQRLSGKEYDLFGVDISRSMCELAVERGINMQCGALATMDLQFDRQFEVITYLYAFGHLIDEAERLSTLIKARELLAPGGVFFADLFCLRNVHEWGKAIQESHQMLKLQAQGYAPGDIFYKRSDGDELAFLHYFTREEIEDLFARAGFNTVHIRKVGYTKYSGELHDLSEEGMYWVQAHV